MNEMIERVARAICFHEVKQQFDCSCAGANACKRWREGFDDAARCVLLAMREPTEAMLLAAREYGGVFTSNTKQDCAPYLEAWQEMIDAALDR